MPTFCLLADNLPAEHRVLCREYAAVQERCSRVIAQQQAEIERLQAQAMRLRATVMVRETALAWAREDQAPWAAGTPGMARHVDALVARIQALLRERLRRQALRV